MLKIMLEYSESESDFSHSINNLVSKLSIEHVIRELIFSSAKDQDSRFSRFKIRINPFHVLCLK